MVDAYCARPFMSRILSAGFIFFVNLGVLMFSTLPTEQLDIDYETQRTSKNRYIRYVIAFTGGIVAIFSSVVYSFLFVINFAICTSFFYVDGENSWFWNRMTYKMSLWYQIYMYNPSICFLLGRFFSSLGS